MIKETPLSTIEQINIVESGSLNSCLLSNGSLLIYNNEGASIWNIKENNILPAWMWKDVKPQVPICNTYITPFPDPTYVLVHKEQKPYLFNMKEQILKEVEVPDAFEAYPIIY